MGTRNLVAVMVDGEYKIAQYGQWDGYPGGTGVNVLEFLSNPDLDASEFKAKVRDCTFLTQEELEAEIGDDEEWTQNYPHFSRDAGSDILGMVLGGVNQLYNSISFAGNSLFCEYAYVIDLDEYTFEVYRGFNENGVVTKGRFKTGDPMLEQKDGWGPVTLVKEYSLMNLPDEEKFLNEVDPDEEDEDDLE